MLASKLLSASGGEDKLFVDDCFAVALYTGNSSTQTITNGIDLAGKGGLVWVKQRSSGTVTDHVLTDTSRGVGWSLFSDLTAGQINGGYLNSFNSNGFTVSSAAATNETGRTFASWTFRKAPKFFDVVTYTGNGVAGRQIPHALGIAPGMVIVKEISNTGGWVTYHRSNGYNGYMYLHGTGAFVSGVSGVWHQEPTASQFYVGTDGEVNESGATYVAYLFAHDDSADGIIQCGSFTTDGSGNATVNLGWEPQFAVIKSSSVATSWYMADEMRGWTADNFYNLAAESSAAETGPSTLFKKTAVGFNITAGASRTYIYLAIRRPNKPPTTGTQVYNAIARTGTGAAATVTGVGFAPDLCITGERASGIGAQKWWTDRLRGVGVHLPSNATDADTAVTTGPTSFNMDGWSLGANASWNYSGASYINHFFRRAPGVFDVVCYTGTGPPRTVPHGLGVAPELIIVKRRDVSGEWISWCQSFAPGFITILNQTSGAIEIPGMFPGAPTATSIWVGSNTNNNTGTFVAYLFASLPGISKVGSYTGNGTTQNIECGFSTGARFVLIKRTDSTGDWYVWDSARGIVSGNEPHLSLNTTAAEVTTDDSVDPDATGFIVNQVAATNINVSGATYIYLSFS